MTELDVTQLPKTILVPIDYEVGSRLAFRRALALARAGNSRVLAVFVWAAPFAPRAIASDELYRAQHDLFERVRHAAAETMVEFIREENAEAAGVEVEWFVVSGDPRVKILEIADERQVDLIVIGSHGRTGIRRLVLGSVAEHTLRHAACPVMIVPAPATVGQNAAES